MLRRGWRQLKRCLPPETPLPGLSCAKRALHDDASDATPDMGWNPGQICELAARADSVAFAQETSQHWPVIAGVQHSLEWIHVTTGCPWWLAISLVTVGFRMLIFPITLIQIKNSVRMANAMPETAATRDRFEKYLAEGVETEKARKWYVGEIAKIWSKHNCNPVRSVAPLFANGFVFVSFFIALRGLSEIKVPSMCYEGLLWFRDLTVSDPFYVLPIVNSLIFWITVEVGAADGMQGVDPSMMHRMKFFMRLLAVAFVPLTASFPASLLCYWISSSGFSLVQSTLIKQPAVRQLLKIPIAVNRPRDSLQSAMLGREVKDGTSLGSQKVGSSVEEVQKLWRDRMDSLIKGKAAQKSTPVVVFSAESRKKQRRTKIRHKKQP